MSSNSETVKNEIVDFFKDKQMSDVNFWIKYNKLISFLYKESTVFLFIFPFFMINFFCRLYQNGTTPETMKWGLFFSVLYFVFYHVVIKRIPQFKRLKETRQESLQMIHMLSNYKVERFNK